MKTEYEMRTFKDAAAWRQWLAENHATFDGLWLRIYKKASGLPTVTYAEALDEALCFGWIDGQVKRYDEESYLQKFTPRRAKSMWSKRNIEHIQRLTEQGLMEQAGLLEVEHAKNDGRWAAAYSPPSEMEASEEFLVALAKHPVAEKFYNSLNKTNRYAIAWQLQTAKTAETRARRQDKIINMLNAEQKLY